MSTRIDAVLFDLDGTLVSTMEPWDRCWADYAARHGHAWSDADRQLTHGRGDWAHHLARVCGIDAVHRVVNDCTDAMIAQVEAGRVEMLPGVRALLANAADAAATGVVSASPRRFVHATLAQFRLHRFLRTVVCGEDPAAAKPDPAPYRYAAHQLGVAPRHCVAVEDSAAGIRSAHTAGMRVLAIPSWRPGTRPAELDLAEYHAADAGQAHGWLRAALCGGRHAGARRS